MPPEAIDARLLSLRKYAQSRGLSHQAVSKAVRSGRIPTVGGKIDPVAADAAWRRNTRPRSDIASEGDSSGSPRVGDRDSGNGHDELALDRPQATYTAARALREVYLAKQAKLDFESSDQKLVRVDEVRAQAFEAARAIRDQLLALPSRLAPVVFAAPDVATCHRLLEEALHDVLGGIAPEDLEKRGPKRRGRRNAK